ncbi:hypothetical protein DB30_03906 [Enhygromyxa salina]|uniref:HTTM-like domain-containing protein n=1 Tax=Enhygromyxa salina TaxID=215803 RepID=A0A0C2DD49_9BACT|nr:HTTM domain-containing protein [Enhygromyxa salina]KIG19350.1 hypothetical protein DB30_03906 [Enhygromyxa salina]
MKPGAWLLSKLEKFTDAEISTRPLGIIRIFAMLVVIHECSSLLVSHRVIDQLPCLLLCWVVLLSMGFALVGYKTRWALGLMAVSFGIVHVYFGVHLRNFDLGKPVQMFQIIVLLWLTPSERSLSIDRYLALRREARGGDPAPPERMPWWQLELYLLEICTIYFWASENKTDPEWLQGARMERYYIEWYGTSDAFVYAPRWVHWGAVFMAYATTALEFTLTFGLLIRRIRHWVWAGGIMLHLGIMLMFSVPFFTSMMFTVLIAALPPQWIHDLIEDLCE